MNNSDFVYTVYIRTTPDKVWMALISPEFTRQYWGGGANVSDWKKGSQWRHVSDDDQRTIRMVGRVLESDPPKRLVLTWADPADTADESRVTFEIEPLDDMVRLNVVHGDFKPGSVMPAKVSQGWPRVLSSLKSLLETGTGLNVRAGKDGECSGHTTKGAAA